MNDDFWNIPDDVVFSEWELKMAERAITNFVGNSISFATAIRAVARVLREEQVSKSALNWEKLLCE